MYREERVYQILQALKTRVTLSNRDVMSMFNISRDTARRDIVRLVEDGLAVRTHGGVALPDLLTEIQSYRSRIAHNPGIKRALARKAASHLAGRSLAFLDVSTTVEELCEHLPDAMTVYTHSLYNVERLMEKACEVHMLGGRMNRKNRFFSGADTLAQMDRIRFDVAVLGAAAVHEDGIYFENGDDAEVKRKAAARSRFVMLIADNDKFLRSGRYRGAEFADIDVVVTNGRPPERTLAALRDAGTALDVWEDGDEAVREEER